MAARKRSNITLQYIACLVWCSYCPSRCVFYGWSVGRIVINFKPGVTQSNQCDVRVSSPVLINYPLFCLQFSTVPYGTSQNMNHGKASHGSDTQACAAAFDLLLVRSLLPTFRPILKSELIRLSGFSLKFHKMYLYCQRVTESFRATRLF